MVVFGAIVEEKTFALFKYFGNFSTNCENKYLVARNLKMSSLYMFRKKYYPGLTTHILSSIHRRHDDMLHYGNSSRRADV